MNKYLSTTGIVLTTLYIIAFVFLVQNKLYDIQLLSLNEIGDFFAGAFGPLAILWLILGFFQQGIELRQNTSALELQAEELKNSVLQQRELVEVTKKQFKAELESLNYEREQYRKSQEPVFVAHGVGGQHSGNKHSYNLNISNVGKTATDVTIFCSKEMKNLTPNQIASWTQDTVMRISFEYMNSIPEDDTLIVINYTGASGISGQVSFSLIPELSGSNPMVTVKKIS
jgi:hypothetical protein